MTYGLFEDNYTADVAEGAATAVEVGGTKDFYQMIGNGTFGSGTLTLYIKPAGASAFVTTGLALTASGLVTVNCKNGDQLKAVLSGSILPNINVTIR